MFAIAPWAAWTMFAISLASAAYAGYSQHQAGQQAAAIARRNAEMQDMARRDALNRGQVEAGKARDRAQRLAARQRTAAASSGFDVNVGTPLDTVVGTVSLGELDALEALNDASREAWGYEARKTNLLFEGESRRRSSVWEAGSTIATGGSQALEDYYRIRPYTGPKS